MIIKIYSEKLIDDIKSEKELDKFLQKFLEENSECILILHFREVDIYKMEYITYKINQYELGVLNKDKKIKIIFFIHLIRKLLSKENNVENNFYYSYNNLLLNIDENKNNYYEHLFIDNLFSEDDYFTKFILSENNNINDVIKKMININSFFNKYIYQIFSYFSYDFYNENNETNKNNYIKKTIIELTKDKNENSLIEFIKQKIIEKIINESSFNIKNILPKIFISNNTFQKDDTDFFDLIKSYIYSSLKTFLFQMIYILEKNNILNPIQ